MPKRYLLGPMTWKVMQRNAWRDIANFRIKQLSNFTKSRRHAWMIINSKMKKMDQLESCPQFAHNVFWKKKKIYIYIPRTGRPDIFRSVNKLARAVTKWTKACDKRLERLISYIHHTCEYRQFCFVGNTAQQCILGLFEDSDFAGDLEDLTSTSCGFLCIFGSHTFCANKLDAQETDFCFTQFYRSWGDFSRCRFTHGWDSRSRSLGLSDLKYFIPHQTKPTKTKVVRESRGNLSATSLPNIREQIPSTNTNRDLTNIDHVPSSGTHSGSNAVLYVFEENEAVIKMIIKGRSPTTRHVSRTHKLLWIGCLTGLILILNSYSIHWNQTSTRTHFNQR